MEKKNGNRYISDTVYFLNRLFDLLHDSLSPVVKLKHHRFIGY